MLGQTPHRSDGRNTELLLQRLQWFESARCILYMRRTAARAGVFVLTSPTLLAEAARSPLWGVDNFFVHAQVPPVWCPARVALLTDCSSFTLPAPPWDSCRCEVPYDGILRPGWRRVLERLQARNNWPHFWEFNGCLALSESAVPTRMAGQRARRWQRMAPITPMWRSCQEFA
jgi:hypothetical protein